ncbi:tyrosine-type recombinase/integrase [Heyndrickxia acidicola]|uniref:Tyrosine-type recombinase/integrase n=1 Tax=Heyndrickxia acidicola TaxID=209389 RepID=A0ABU6MP09_9BACI|nr:tyrosine-type recombinase/integrase [Heyndrickxia acidicola]MED1206107.1 tyrosine-type recombinase/integrase [Heyndrickxia acidicola]
MNNVNSELIQEFIFQLGKAENTKKSYQRDLEILNRYLSKVNVRRDELTQETIQMFIDSLESGLLKNTKGDRYNPSSINRIFAAIRVFTDYTDQRSCIKDIQINKTTHISKQLAPKSVEAEDIASIRLKIANSRKASSKRDLAIVDMLQFTGMRVGELVELKLKDIEYDETTKKYLIHINQSKGNKVRTVPIAKDKYDKTIKRYLDTRKDDIEYVFILQREKQLTTRSIQLLLQHYGITPHMLRHTFCALLARSNKLDISMIAELAGHSVAVAQRYTKPTLKQMSNAVDEAFTLD